MTSLNSIRHQNFNMIPAGSILKIIEVLLRYIFVFGFFYNIVAGFVV
jgi:hypothetical protein